MASAGTERWGSVGTSVTASNRAASARAGAAGAAAAAAAPGAADVLAFEDVDFSDRIDGPPQPTNRGEQVNTGSRRGGQGREIAAEPAPRWRRRSPWMTRLRGWRPRWGSGPMTTTSENPALPTQKLSFKNAHCPTYLCFAIQPGFLSVLWEEKETLASDRDRDLGGYRPPASHCRAGRLACRTADGS